jgi:hypothetical protein
MAIPNQLRLMAERTLSLAKKVVDQRLIEWLSIRAAEYLEEAQALEAATPPLREPGQHVVQRAERPQPKTNHDDDDLLALVERRTAEVRQIVAQQKARIDRLKSAGLNTPEVEQAEQALLVFEVDLVLFDDFKVSLLRMKKSLRATGT